MGVWADLGISSGTGISKRIILGLMLLVTLSICGTIVLKIFDVILHIGFDNIFFEGFKVGLFATVVLLIGAFRKNKAKS